VVVLVGGGTRARHIYSIASELEMPVGVVATLGKYIPMQNARMIQMLLANHGGLYILPDDFEKLPLYLQLGCTPVMSGMPPFGYWEKREEGSRIPPHRTDAGVFLSAEFLGAPRAIFIKDEDGLFTDDPKKDPSAQHIPRISAAQLVERNLPDVVVERVVVEYLGRARWCKELQVVNGLKPGEVLKALRGESNGSIIHA
jgi:molybdenum storage protein